MIKDFKNLTDSQLTGIAYPWPDIAIRQRMGCKNGKDHQDWKDEPSVFNTIVPFKNQVWSEESVFL